MVGQNENRTLPTTFFGGGNPRKTKTKKSHNTKPPKTKNDAYGSSRPRNTNRFRECFDTARNTKRIGRFDRIRVFEKVSYGSKPWRSVLLVWPLHTRRGTPPRDIDECRTASTVSNHSPLSAATTRMILSIQRRNTLTNQSEGGTCTATHPNPSGADGRVLGLDGVKVVETDMVGVKAYPRVKRTIKY